MNDSPKISWRMILAMLVLSMLTMLVLDQFKDVPRKIVKYIADISKVEEEK